MTKEEILRRVQDERRKLAQETPDMRDIDVNIDGRVVYIYDKRTHTMISVDR